MLSFFTYTPLITAQDFAGITADVGTASAGIIAVVLVVVGLGILIKTLTR